LRFLQCTRLYCGCFERIPDNASGEGSGRKNETRRGCTSELASRPSPAMPSTQSGINDRAESKRIVTAAAPKKQRDRHGGRALKPPPLAFRNTGWGRSFALAIGGGLWGGRAAQESKRRCRKKSEFFPAPLLCHKKQKNQTKRITPPLVRQSHTENFN